MVAELAIVLFMAFVTVVAMVVITIAHHRASQEKAVKAKQDLAARIAWLEKELDQTGQEQNREAL